MQIAEGRVHGEYDAVETPIGYIPKYEDLEALFREIFDRQYAEADYEEQFTIRIQKFLEKLDRMDKIYAEEEDIPRAFSDCLAMLRRRLVEAREKYGSDAVSPARLSG